MFSNRRSTMLVSPAVAQQLKADIAAAAEPRNAPSSILMTTTSTLPGFRIKIIMGTERLELVAVSMEANAVIGVGYEQGELLGGV